LGEFINESSSNVALGRPNSSLNTKNTLCWDKNKCGTGIGFLDNDTHVFLKEQAYVFRTVIGNIGFESGVNYWEIIADSKTENELKIGIAGSKDFDMNSAFCDHVFGYAFYGTFLI
jgi:hypothetical protein